MSKNIFKILLFLFFSIGAFTQPIDYALCKGYISEIKDDSLSLYLKNIEPKILAEDMSIFYYFKSLEHRYTGDSDKQIDYLYKGLNLINESKPDSIHAFLLDELSIVLQKNYSDSDSREALELINESINIKSALRLEEQLGKSFLIKGNAYTRMNRDFNDAQLDSALFSYDKAITYLNSEELRFLAKENMASIFTSKGMYYESLQLLNECYNYYELAGRNFDRSTAAVTLSELYIRTKQYDEAAEILDTLLDYTLHKDWLELSSVILYYKGELADSVKDFKSAIFWKDSLFEFQHKIFDDQSIEAEEKYKSLFLKTQLSEEKAKVLKNRLWLSVLAGLSLMLVFFSFLISRFYKLKRRAADQELENEKIKSALNATRAKMDGEQKERQAIASVLHDQMASSLTAAQINLSVAKKKDNPLPFVEKAETILSTVNKQVRDLSHQLISASLIKFGLATAIESLADNMSTDDLVISFETNMEKLRFENTREVFLFRSCSELIQNIHKHSTATKTKIILNATEDDIELSVIDNGQQGQGNKKMELGLGLVTIKDRAEAFGGSFLCEHQEHGFFNMITIARK
jgi:signal transduction histidine kinase